MARKDWTNEKPVRRRGPELLRLLQRYTKDEAYQLRRAPQGSAFELRYDDSYDVSIPLAVLHDALGVVEPLPVSDQYLKVRDRAVGAIVRNGYQGPGTAEDEAPSHVVEMTPSPFRIPSSIESILRQDAIGCPMELPEEVDLIPYFRSRHLRQELVDIFNPPGRSVIIYKLGRYEEEVESFLKEGEQVCGELDPQSGMLTLFYLKPRAGVQVPYAFVKGDTARVVEGFSIWGKKVNPRLLARTAEFFSDYSEPEPIPLHVRRLIGL